MYQLNFPLILRDWRLLADGLLLSLQLAAVSIGLGAVIGLAAALLRTSRWRRLHPLVTAYVELVRNVPLLLLLFIVYFGLPSVGVYWFDEVQSAVVALTFYAGAYLTEVFRAGLESVSRAHIDAGRSLGLTPWQVITVVVLPIMFRVVLPSMGNMLISLFKDTSLAAAISIRELTYAGVMLNVKTWRVVEIWSLIAAAYIGTTVLFSTILRRIERRLAIPR